MRPSDGRTSAQSCESCTIAARFRVQTWWRRTGLTRSAIRGLIGELALRASSPSSPAPRQGTPGRPSPLVQPSPRGAIVLALEIAVDSLAVAAVGIGGEVLDVVRLDRPRDRSSVDETIADLAALGAPCSAGLPDTEGLIGIGVAIVGIVRRDAGRRDGGADLGWRDVPLGDRLADALGTSLPIAVANEADLGALAELRRGAPSRPATCSSSPARSASAAA